jgi:hypothetical protein
MTLNRVNMEKIISPEIDYGLICPKFRLRILEKPSTGPFGPDFKDGLFTSI